MQKINCTHALNFLLRMRFGVKSHFSVFLKHIFLKNTTSYPLSKSTMKLTKTRWFFLYYTMNTRTPMQPYLSNSLAIRQEIQRFESVHPSIYAIYDLIDAIPDHLIQQQIREHVVCIEGRFVSVTWESDHPILSVLDTVISHSSASQVLSTCHHTKSYYLLLNVDYSVSRKHL